MNTLACPLLGGLSSFRGVFLWSVYTRVVSSACPLLRGCPLSEVISQECVYKSTFGLSFVGRFVL